jgi:ATP-dependent helicase HrpA
VWRRFELPLLAATESIPVPGGQLAVFPRLARHDAGVVVSFEWSAAEADAGHWSGAARLARTMLERQARDLARRVAEDSVLLLGASPYLQGQPLIDALLQTVFHRACFGDEPIPRERPAFEGCVERARGALSDALDAACGEWRTWFEAARAVRRLIDDPRAASRGELAAESRAYLAELLDADSLASAPRGWLRQIPRYLQAEERRWQRLLARRQEPPIIARELAAWKLRAARLRRRAAAELRDPPPLEELRWWIRELRVSLVAQELKTLGPVSSARLEQRAVAIEAWLAR